MDYEPKRPSGKALLKLNSKVAKAKLFVRCIVEWMV